MTSVEGCTCGSLSLLYRDHSVRCPIYRRADPIKRLEDQPQKWMQGMTPVDNLEQSRTMHSINNEILDRIDDLDAKWEGVTLRDVIDACSVAPVFLRMFGDVVTILSLRENMLREQQQQEEEE